MLNFSSSEFRVSGNTIGVSATSLLGNDHYGPTLPLSGRQGVWGGAAVSWWWPVHSRGLFEGYLHESTERSYIRNCTRHHESIIGTYFTGNGLSGKYCKYPAGQTGEHSLEDVRRTFHPTALANICPYLATDRSRVALIAFRASSFETCPKSANVHAMKICPEKTP